MKSSRGFTLVELLIAISVLAIVAVLGWRGLDSIVRARVALNSDLSQTRGLQLAFAQMQSDASHIATSASIGGRITLEAQPGRLTLVRTVFADNQPSRIQVISYRVRDGVLTRRESAATRDLKELDTAWSAAIGDTDASQPVELQSGVSGMAIRTWGSDGMGWRTGTENAPTGMTGASSETTNPPNGTTNPPNGTTNPPNGTTGAPSRPGATGMETFTGLEVALQLRDRQNQLVKIFLLGAV